MIEDLDATLTIRDKIIIITLIIALLFSYFLYDTYWILDQDKRFL
jgi:hypothetical protein